MAKKTKRSVSNTAYFQQYKIRNLKKVNKIARMERTLKKQPNNKLLADSIERVKQNKAGIKGKRRIKHERADGTTYTVSAYKKAA